MIGSRCTKLLIKEVQVIDFQAPLVLTEEQHACGPWRVGCDVHTSKCKSGKTLDSGRVFDFTTEPIFVGHGTSPRNGFLSDNLREFGFACHLEYFANRNFLGCYHCVCVCVCVCFKTGITK